MRSLLSVLLAALALAAQTSAAKPNVLLICVDDLKPVLGCYGDSVAITPNLDALAARGMVFEGAYCNQAVCSPSRNTLMTGLRPQTIGIYDLPTHFRKAVPNAVTVAQHFRKEGYRTEALGKVMHAGHGNQEDAPSWVVPHWKPKAPTYALPASIAAMEANPEGRGPTTESAPVADDFYADGKLAREAVARLEAAAQKPGEPFFMAVGFIRPHLPFVAPEKYWDLYPSASIPMPQVTEPPIGAPDYAGNPGGEMGKYSGVPKGLKIDEAYARRLIHGYYAATSYTDAQIGLVLDALDRTGLAANTIVVLWGDHGWHLGDHGFWCKHTNYEQAARIPLILAGPGVASGARTGALVETADLYPTLAELAGLPQPRGLDGRSFAPTLADPATPARDSVIHVYPRGGRMGRAIRTQRHRLVEWKPLRGSDATEFELYDYQEDPLETKNLAKEQPEPLAQLRAILAEHPDPKPQFKD
jgi:iduronate 2-sulfatase